MNFTSLGEHRSISLVEWVEGHIDLMLSPATPLEDLPFLRERLLGNIRRYRSIRAIAKHTLANEMDQWNFGDGDPKRLGRIHLLEDLLKQTRG